MILMDEWKAIRMRKSVIDMINQFLKTPDANRLGFSSAADFVDYVTRKRLEEISLSRFEHFNFHENIIRVLDKDIGERGDIVEIFKKNGSLKCSYCDNTDCVHIKYLWTDFDLAKILKEKNIKSPF